MSFRIFLISCIVLITAVVAINIYNSKIISQISISGNSKNRNEKIISIKYPSVFDLNDADKELVKSALAKMSVYEKCAQLVMPIVYRKDLHPATKGYKEMLDLVRNYGIGGIVISTGDYKGVVNLINEMQNNAEIPLLFAADFENGLGMRIDEMVSYPHSMAIGATGNSDYAFQTGKMISSSCKMIGINTLFSPVADINENAKNPVINLRSYSEDPIVVSEFCKSFILGAKENKVLTTVKHFPGHGNTSADSHDELPLITGKKSTLLKKELRPFEVSIKAGVHSVMTGHLEIPALESENKLPASLSYSIVTEFLKNELGFDGLIITDALNMKAITNKYSAGEAAIKAFNAGNDILLMPDDTKLAIEALYNAVNNGSIKTERLNQSVAKILSAKVWLELLPKVKTNNTQFESATNLTAENRLAKEIAENSLTILKLDTLSNGFKIDNAKETLLLSISNRKSFSNTHFTDIVNKKYPSIKTNILNSKTKKKEYKLIQSAIEGSKKVIVALNVSSSKQTNNGNLLKEQIELIEQIIAQDKELIIINFENPYLASQFPKVKNYICTFSNSEASQEAALKFLEGKLTAKGKLPVSIPKTPFVIGYKWDH